MKVTSTEIFQMLQEQDVSAHVLQELEYDSSLKEAGVDSLDTTLLFFSIQEKHGIEVSDAEVAMLDSINAISEWLNEKLSAA
jgi:acyl carrier protein